MKIIYIFLLIVIIFSTGHLQQFKSIQPNFVEQNQNWPIQILYPPQGNYYGGVRRVQAKPCGRRQNPNADQWTPTFKSRMTKPFQNGDNVVLKPQSLKNEDFHTETNIKPEVSNNQGNLENQRSNEYDDSRTFKERNDLTSNRAANDCDPESDERQAVAVVLADNNETEETDDNFETEKDKDKSETIKCFNKNELATTKNSYKDSRRFLLNTDDLDSKNLNNSDVTNENSPNSNSEQDPEPDTFNVNLKMSEKVADQRSFIKLEKINNRVVEPTKGVGVLNISEFRAILLESPRVCYACSTASSATCWAPDKRTTVKYCSKDHDACVTKTFKTKSALIIRDCGKRCDGTGHSALVPNFETCSICHSDLCNGACSTYSYHLLYVTFLIMLTKHTILVH